MSVPRRLWVGVLMVLLAAALRLTGIGYGQPIPAYAPEDAALNTIHENTPIHPDEFLFVQRPLRMLLTRQLNPKFFHNPSFLINANLAVYWITGEHHHISWDGRDDIGARRAAPFRLYINGRTLSALGGVLAVAATFAAAYHLAGRFGAVSAALIVAVSLPMVQHAHYSTTSSLAAGFAAVAVWAGVLSLRRFRGWMFIIAGIAAGLAAGSRYNAAAVSLVVFVVGLAALYPGWTWRRVVWVLLGYALFPLTFLFTTPHVIFDTAFFWSEFQSITNQYIGSGNSLLNVPKYIGLGYELNYLALYGIGVPGALLAVVGVGLALRDRGRRMAALALLAYLLPYGYVVLRTIRPLGADQMLVPVIPAVALFAGIGAAGLQRRFLPGRRFAAGVFFAVLVAYPLVASVAAVWRLTQTDTRYIAQAWIAEHIPAGAVFHLNGPYNVPLDRTLYTWSQTYGGQDPLDITTLRENGVQYVIESDAWLLQLERAGFIPLEERAAQRRAFSVADDGLTVLYTVPRPTMPGIRHPMHSLSYWHHPEITIYCLTQAACDAASS